MPYIRGTDKFRVKFCTAQMLNLFLLICSATFCSYSGNDICVKLWNTFSPDFFLHVLTPPPEGLSINQRTVLEARSVEEITT